jgi:SAM-dependent methyltransferase
MSDFNEEEYLTLYPDVRESIKSGVFKTGYVHYQRHGKAEGRSPNASSYKTPREKNVFQFIDKDGLGLEIGPSHNPMAPKKKGYKVHILDHVNADELRSKYQGHNLNLDNIEEVDFIWRGQPLTELIGKIECYDWIIASHVVEHIPNLISFLQQCEKLLKPNGVLSLVVPDKRYCFDYFQPLSSTGMLLDAHTEERVRPSSGQVFDHFANSSSCNKGGAWSAECGEADAIIHSFSEAIEHYRAANETNEYIDVHCWRFIPESFNLILHDLFRLELLLFEVKAQSVTDGCEFYVSLSKIKNTSKNINNGLRFKQLKNITDNTNV